MHRVEKSVEVKAALPIVYLAWTRFEDFPEFMEGVKEVRPIGQGRLYWRAEILGKAVEWEAEIEEQRINDRIMWRSVVGHPNQGEVRFFPIDPVTTLVTVAIEYEPLGVAEKIADFLGLVSLRVEGDLTRFKNFIESQEVDPGIWSGVMTGDVA